MGKEAINTSIGVPWRLVDGKWPVDGPEPEFGVDPLPPPPIPLAGARGQRKRITNQDIDAFGTTVGCPACNAIRIGKRAQAHSDRHSARIEGRVTEGLGRRIEVINEATAEEVPRSDKRMEDDSRTVSRSIFLTRSAR